MNSKDSLLVCVKAKSSETHRKRIVGPSEFIQGSGLLESQMSHCKDCNVNK